MHRICFLVLLAGTLHFSAQAGSPPGLMHYQGRLTNTQGSPISSATEVTFTFWYAQSGGNQIGTFSDTDTVLPSNGGYYETLIGDDPNNLIPPGLFAHDP